MRRCLLLAVQSTPFALSHSTGASPPGSRQTLTLQKNKERLSDLLQFSDTVPSPALDWLGTGGGPARAPRAPPSPSTDQSEEQRDLRVHRKRRPSPGPATRSPGRIGDETGSIKGATRRRRRSEKQPFTFRPGSRT